MACNDVQPSLMKSASGFGTCLPGGGNTYPDDAAGTDLRSKVCGPVAGTGLWSKHCGPVAGTSLWSKDCGPIAGTDLWSKDCGPIAGTDLWSKDCGPVAGTDLWSKDCGPIAGTSLWSKDFGPVAGTGLWSKDCGPVARAVLWSKDRRPIETPVSSQFLFHLSCFPFYSFLLLVFSIFLCCALLFICYLSFSSSRSETYQVTWLPLFSRSVVATASPSNVLTDRAERRNLRSVGLQTDRTLKCLVLLSDWMPPYFWQKAVFWIPLMRSRSNFAHNYWRPPTGDMVQWLLLIQHVIWNV